MSVATESPASTRPAISALVEKLRAGDVRSLSRAITLVENQSPDAPALLSACFPHTGKSLILGLTGAPGAGKSTLTHRIALRLREQGLTVGVIAVDPTSPFTGGAILGDRIRMQGQEEDTGLYIRSMATRGFLGGLARTTADAVTVMEASGRDVILIETVGVGQDEVDIVRLADVTVVLLVPGMGDDVQTIKAGIMEIAHVFVINKADREGADRVEREIRTMQSLVASHAADDWIAPVVRTIASTGEGTGKLLEQALRYRDYLNHHGLRNVRRRQNWRTRIVEMLKQQFVENSLGTREGEARLDALAAAVAGREADPYTAVPGLLQEILRGQYED